MNGRPFEEQVAGVAARHEPLRRRLHELVASRDGPVSGDEAVSALGLSRSVAAFRLDKLAEAGLCEVEFRRTSRRSGPGAGRAGSRPGWSPPPARGCVVLDVNLRACAFD